VDDKKQRNRGKGRLKVKAPVNSTIVNTKHHVIYANLDNSLLSKYEELCTLAHDQNLDVMAFTEIKPKKGSIPSTTILDIQGYTCYISDLDAENTRGVCIYVTDRLKSTQLTSPVTDNYKDAVWIKLIGTDNTNTLVGCIYRSGTPNTAKKYDPELHEALRYMSNLPGFQDRLFMGDFNHNRISWEPVPSVPDGTANSAPERTFIECIRDTFMHQHITKPTRYREGQRPTLDDLILTNDEQIIQDLEYKPSVGKSDHVMLSFNLVQQGRTQKTYREKLCYDKGDYSKMETMLSRDWTTELADKNVQEQMDYLETCIQEAINECIPKKKICTSRPTGRPVWMSDRALRKTRRKHSAWIRYLNTLDGEDYQKYIKKRNEAQHALRKARRQFERGLAKDCKRNNKAVWSYINSRRTRSGIAQLAKSDGTLTQTDQEIAEVLGEQYYKTFTKEDMQGMPVIDDKPLNTQPLLKFTINKEAVHKVLKNVKIDKSPGLDGIHPRLLSEMAETLSTPLTQVFQTSLDTGELPRQWKDAVVSPIFKKGSRKLPQNYRPVSLTSIVCKLLERLVVNQIIQHLEENQLKSKEQHGFTKGKSTVTNLLEALNVWTESLMHGTPVDILYLDYAKAFDTVPHERLLRQISSFGIKNKALSWVRAFLTGRRQKVRVNSETSTWKTVDSGVPQGSVLGPTLFAMFVADVPGEVSSPVSLFADDTKMYESLNKENSSDELNSNLSKLQKWSERMQMMFHPDKCIVMHLGSNNPNNTYTLPKSDGSIHTLGEATHEKDLGVTIDDKLKFSDHINQCVSKANRVLGCLRHTFKHMTPEIFLQLYKALIRPHLEYASCIWSPHLKKDIEALEWVQRRATKIIPELRDLPYTERLKRLNLPTLLFRRKRADMLQLYKLMHGLDSIEQLTRCSRCPAKKMFQLVSKSQTRGHDLKLYKQEATGIRTHFFGARVINDWNNLSQSTVTAISVNRFKSSLRKDWANHPDLFTIEHSQ